MSWTPAPLATAGGRVCLLEMGEAAFPPLRTDGAGPPRLSNGGWARRGSTPWGLWHIIWARQCFQMIEGKLYFLYQNKQPYSGVECPSNLNSKK